MVGQRVLVGFLATMGLLGTGLVGYSLADIPDSSTGEITACRASGDAGNTRIIDKEGGKNCHAYEDEISWPSEQYAFEPKATVGSFSSVGTATVREVNCPTGHKFIEGRAGDRVADPNAGEYPGYYRNGNTANVGSTYPIYQYITDGSDVITGFKFKQAPGYSVQTLIICTP